MSLGLCWLTLACGDPSNAYRNSERNYSNPDPSVTNPAATTQLQDGQYPVQQVSYDDGDGRYNVLLLNTPPGTPSNFETRNLPMARLTNEEIAQGQKSYLKVEQGQPSLYLTEDFRIQYTHNVTETRPNPQTGQSETVVVRQEPSFWSPFAGALAGQVVGNLLFRPQYYMPPVYQPGLPLTGFGGYGNTYGQAVSRYQTRYQAPPAEVQNRQTLRTSGQLRSPNTGYSPGSRTSLNNDRATGSGYGSSNLRQSDGSSRPRYSSGSRSSRGFGSGRSRSFGGSRRR